MVQSVKLKIGKQILGFAILYMHSNDIVALKYVVCELMIK